MATKQASPQYTSRTTKSGRKLWYELSVIQEPSRARACGSGAKSSADRRPVDPPPVVKLQIYEEKDGSRQDITFAYTANFFLFATLEVARPIAHGRVQQAPSPIVPVLTGMPVSGMAYLDRPNEAGYFIFPDLSVRHEGSYKLSFNLYEQTKLEEDRDGENSTDQKAPINGPAPDSSFDWRMEIKSAPFVVFSAKKFPGLAESTSLSRTVAEQGCRVRIRRDVRMRRRDGKGGADENQEDEYSRIGRPQEQEAYPRSRSNSDSPTGDGHRSPTYDGTGPDSHGTPAFYSPSVPPQQNGQQKGNWLNFGQQPGQLYQGPPQFAQPQQPQPPTPYQSAPPSYQPAAPPQYHPAPQPPPSNYDVRQYPQTAYPRERESDIYRRASFPPPPPQSAPYRPLESAYQPARTMYSPPGPQVERVSLPPLKTVVEAPQPPPVRRPMSPMNRIPAAPLPSPSYDHPPERTSYYSQPASYPTPTETTGKRSWDSSFSAASRERERERLLNGQRPNDLHTNSDTFDDPDGMDTSALTYKRAAGHFLSRPCPEYE